MQDTGAYMISKKDQTHKVKSVSTKNMSAVELRLYKDFILELAQGSCQCCGKPGKDFHHSMYGAYKSDTSLVLICREEHAAIHFGTDTKEAERLKVLTKGIGRSNWEEYTK